MPALAIALAAALAAGAVLAAHAGAAAAPQAAATASVTNPIAAARPAETVEVTVESLKRALTFDDVRKIHVKDDKTGQDLLTQAVDLDDDGTFELVIFQADLAASERRTFSLSVGARRIALRDEFRAYGRFVRERRDDFAWENDLVAHRMYGAALETWAQEPLTSSAVDIWVKKTPRLVVSDWYMVDDYHRDLGEGADFYSAGKTRGCGGTGIWQNGKLYPSANFRGSRVLANGPLRVMFELSYDAWDAGGQKLSETKRISLDAGQRLNRFESRYSVPAPRVLQQAVGIKKAAGADVSVRKESGVMRTWEAFANNNGNVGCGVIADPRDVADAPELDGNVLLVTRVAAGRPAIAWAGSAWDRGGTITTAAAWDRYLDDWAARLRAPVVVQVRGAGLRASH
jgi:pectinesterase